MVERGTDVNKGISTQPPIVQAVRRGHEDVTSFPLAYGAKQGVRAPLWDDPITAAAANGYVGTISILLGYAADINSRLGQRATTPLYRAARYNRVDTVCFLLEKGAVLDVIQNDMVIYLGYEALERAIKKGDKGIVQALAKGGVDVKAVAPDRTDNYPPPVILAKMWGQVDMVILLLGLGAKDVDPLETRWAEDFRRGVYPKSS